MGKDENVRKIVIVGCGRSGTRYIAKICRVGGLDVGHEIPRPKGTASWYATAVDTADPMELLPIEGYEKALFLHQVRDPVKTISSFQRVDSDPYGTWKFIGRNLPEFSMEDSRIQKCMVYWRYWNLLAEGRAEWTYRVEDIFEDQVFDRFCRLTGADPGKKADMQKVSKRYNYKHLVFPPLQWGDILHENEKLAAAIADQAKRYGYEI